MGEVGDAPAAGGEPGRVLGIDPGERRVGLAVSDPERRVALGLPTFTAGHGKSLVDHLRGLLITFGVGRVVVGYPRSLDGSVGTAARRATALARRLRRDLGVAVELWDERLTTVQAERVLRGTRAEPGARDRIAATLILQSYLDRSGQERK